MYNESVLSKSVNSFFHSTDWPNDAEILDVTFGMKCGIAALKGKIPKKLQNKITKRKPGAAIRRAAQTFSVCPEARGTFAANVS